MYRNVYKHQAGSYKQQKGKQGQVDLISFLF